MLSVHDEQEDDPDKLLMKVMLVSLVRDKVAGSPLLRGTHDEFCVRSCPGSFATAGTAGRRPGTGRHAHFPKQHLPVFVAKIDINFRVRCKIRNANADMPLYGSYFAVRYSAVLQITGAFLSTS